MRHEAIHNTHPNVVTVDDGLGAFDKDGNSVTIDEDKVSQEIQKLLSAEPMRLLRQERNRRIAETDWWVLPDRTASQEQKDYRQALRNLPSTAEPQLDEEGNLTNVTWPTKPT